MKALISLGWDREKSLLRVEVSNDTLLQRSVSNHLCTNLKGILGLIKNNLTYEWEC